MGILHIFLVLLVTVELITAFGHLRNARKWLRASDRRPPTGKLPGSPVEEFYVEQPIDHSNPTLGNYKQRVQYNGQYYKENDAGSIVFLMIGGEGMMSDLWVTRNYSYIQWAQKYGAAVFQLEHRCFGFSRPYNNMATSTLKFCTIGEALEDAAAFIPLMNKRYAFTKARWVTFGGSYPGALNAWFRELYPDLTVGAVASSAVINLKFDYFEYAMVAEETLRTTGDECHSNVGKAFELIIQKSLTAEGRKELSDVFKLDPPFDEKTTLLDIQNFVANLFTLEFQDAIQYTYDGRNNATMGGLSVENICNIITDVNIQGDPLKQIKAMIDFENSYYPETNYNVSFPNSYSEMIKELTNETYDDENSCERASARGWMWLCCNELGSFQTTDQGRNIFGNIVPLNYFLDMCTDLFGPEYAVETVHKNNLEAKKKYHGPEKFNATNIILPNGSFDPCWKLGTFINKTDQHLFTILIDKAAHCSDMYPPWEGEPKALPDARKLIERELDFYITSAAVLPVTPPTASTTPKAQPTTPTTPKAQPTTPTIPNTQPTTPTTPAIPNTQPTTPTTPKAQATTPKGASSLSMSPFNGLIFAAFALLLR